MINKPLALMSAVACIFGNIFCLQMHAKLCSYSVKQGVKSRLCYTWNLPRLDILLYIIAYILPFKYIGMKLLDQGHTTDAIFEKLNTVTICSSKIFPQLF